MSPREIDALVAEHCMGWTPPAHKMDCRGDRGWSQKNQGGSWRFCIYGENYPDETLVEEITDAEFKSRYLWKSPEGEFVDKPGAYSDSPIEPSSDPAASKQLRDKMHWEGWYYCIRLCDAFSGGDGKLYCHFYKHDRDVSGEEWADTEEMAVALAALSAVGKPVAL